MPEALQNLNLVNEASDEQLLNFLGDAEENGTGGGQNTAPEIAEIEDLNLIVGQSAVLVELDASDEDGDSLTYQVRVQEMLATQIMSEHGLHEISWRDDYAFNWGGQNEKWLRGEQGWYFLLPDGTLNLWNGSFTDSVQIAEFPDLIYDDPQQLIQATPSDLQVEIIDAQVLVTTGSQLGTFQVEVTVSDGTVAENTTFSVHVANTAPILDLENQTLVAGIPLNLELPTHDADGHEVTYSFEAMGNQLSALNEEHGFCSNGNYHTNYLGHQERWIRDESGQWHFLLPDGGLYRWQASFAGSTLIAEPGSAVYDDPSLLTDPQDVAIVATLSGNDLTIVAPSDYEGQIYIRVVANDGYQTVSEVLRLSVVLPDDVDAAFASDMSFLF